MVKNKPISSVQDEQFSDADNTENIENLAEQNDLSSQESDSDEYAQIWNGTAYEDAVPGGGWAWGSFTMA